MIVTKNLEVKFFNVNYTFSYKIILGNYHFKHDREIIDMEIPPSFWC